MAGRNRTAGSSRLSYPEHFTGLIEDYLAALDYGEDASVSLLSEAMNYSLLAGGKRIRPVLLMASAETYGADPAAMLPTAAALEMIHTYSLIHDDLPSFDDDDLRRGRPTCHVRFGENVAILAGDALFAEAFRLICERQSAQPDVILQVIEEIAIATGVQGMVGGQYLDVSHDGGETQSDELAASAAADGSREGFAASESALKLLHSLKTGRLIMACVHCGGLLAGAAENELKKLRRFAAELGLLFQIKDDILDVVGETAVLGKQAGSDERLMRRTYISVYGLDKSERLAGSVYERALSALNEVGGPTETLAAVTNYIYERQR